MTLSERGEAAVDAALTDLLNREQSLLAGLDAGELGTLASLLRTLLAPFDATGR